ncbi:hypothetical protein GKZ89_02650 [Bacillus mangrovi]|uniref:Uncharacterized protein n=1 Tax=Metabacillus mangrovi TaxID=1491830 RepID=A0A7X2V3Q7_9BACI|nr:hypothetical protein [Metabacillus mangrovi]MTH52291.1 hypothetical protein [Metabacillus mangrovi]
MNVWVRQGILYLAFLLLGIWLLFEGSMFELRLQEEGKEIYDLRTLLAFQGLFPVALGMLFAVPDLVLDFWREGRWRIQWMRLIFFGLPLLYALFVNLQFLSGGNLLPVPPFFPGGSYVALYGAGFGFLLISSIRKQPV